jgi:hypothetical protein
MAAVQASSCAVAAVAHLSMRFASTAFSKQPAIFLIAIFSFVFRFRAELHEHTDQPVAPQSDKLRQAVAKWPVCQNVQYMALLVLGFQTAEQQRKSG